MSLSNSFAILFVFLSCIFTNTSSQYRIIGGTDWDIRGSPYVAAIFVDGHYRCSGAFITLQKVLTSGFCLENIIPSRITIKAGATDLLKAKTFRTAVRIIRPSDLTTTPVDMDLAVIFYNGQICERPNIKTISLCRIALNPGVKLLVSSWGSKTRNDLEGSNILQSAEFEVIPINDCKARYASHYAAARKTFPETVICLTDPAQASDVCYGDGGAPAVKDGKLCAVLSGGHPNDAIIYTSMTNSKVREFIESAKRS